MKIDPDDRKWYIATAVIVVLVLLFGSGEAMGGLIVTAISAVLIALIAWGVYRLGEWWKRRK